MTISKIDAITEVLNDYRFDICAAMEVLNWVEQSELEDELNTRVYEQEIIGNHQAMEYLLENDPSLSESIEIALDNGYELSGINSEVLATLLYQNKLSQDLHGLIQAINEALENIEEEEEEEEEEV